ncbi:MAG: tetratricopeptide repeat protein [Candidatus Thorarchaeota archaeon]
MFVFPSKELKSAKELIDEGKYEEALLNLKDIEQKITLTLEEKLEIQTWKGLLHYSLGQLEIALKIAEQIHQNSKELKMPLFTIDALFIKVVIFTINGRFEYLFNTIGLMDNILKLTPRKNTLEYHKREAEVLFAKGLRDFYASNFDRALDHLNRSVDFYEQNPSIFHNISSVLGVMAYTYRGKGELDLALEYNKKALSQIPKGEYFGPMFLKADLYRNMGDIYYEKGELNSALEYEIRALEIYKKIKEGWWIGWSFFNIIRILLAKKDIVRVQNYSKQFKEFIEEHEFRLTKSLYQLSQALILKSSVRMRDHVESEHKLKEIVEKNETAFVTNIALINLCDLYFREFRVSNQMEILDDIYPLINHLHENAVRSNSYSLLANVKLLQAKLALLQINMVEARKFLTEAQTIADEHGLQLLAQAISKEHDNLLEELKLWESIKKTKASVSERLKMASIDEVLERMAGRRAIEPSESTDEQPVLLLILAEGGILLFSYPFTDKWKQDDDLFGSFLSAFTSFSDEFFSKGLDRAKFGEETILMQSVSSFSVCYLFKGQTYSAKQKLDNFIQNIQKSSSIWETLEKNNKLSQVVNLNDIPQLENLVTGIFLN